MASISLARMPDWGKPTARLPGVRGPPLSPGFRLWVVVFVGLAPRAPASGLPDSHRDLMPDVSKATSQCLAWGLCPIVLSLSGPHGLTTSLTALNRRRRRCSVRGLSSAHIWGREK
jgi:hypothetical protein